MLFCRKIAHGSRHALFYGPFERILLQLDLAAGLFDLLLQLLGLVLGHALLQGLGSALDSGLGLSQALAGDLADDLDDLDLGSGVKASQDHVEVGLLLSSGSSSAASSGSSHGSG